MTYTLIDFFNGFQSLKRRKRFSAGAQSTYFAILAEFNSAYFPESISISTRDLQQLAGLKSVSSAHECRNVLKNSNLIDFKTQNCTTVYRLLTEHLPNKNGLGAEHQPNVNRTAGGFFNIPACEDSRLETENSVRSQSARERGTEKEEETLSNREHAQASETAATIDEVVDYWERTLLGGRMTVEHQSELLIYLNDPEKGLEWVKEAMKEASDANSNPHGLSFKLLRGVIEKKKTPKPEKKKSALKGGEKNGRKRYEEEDPREKWEYSNR